METTTVSFNTWMDKQPGVNWYKGILSNFLKWAIKPWRCAEKCIVVSERSQSEKVTYSVF